MKVRLSLLIIAIVIMSTAVLMIGCKYDVAPPLWNEPYTEPSSPTISQVDPAVATPGVNIITIRGEKFAGSLDSNLVYFGTLPAEIVSVSSTAIAVRRPNLVSDTCTIKVVRLDAFLEAKKGPYKIDPVSSKYGSFSDNVALSVVAVDGAENLYIIDQVNQNRIYKVTPDGSKSFDTLQTRLPRYPRDAVIGPDGRLYLIGLGASGGNKEITAVNLTTHPYQWTTWRTVGAKSHKYGDFDANGYFYTGGVKTDLFIVAPAPDTTFKAAGMYSADSLFAIRVFGGYLYVAARLSTGEKGVWRHLIGANGALGAKELFLDFRSDSTVAGRTIESIAMSANGTMYIGTDSPNPLLVVIDGTPKKMDYFYKNILPPYAKSFVWGTGHYAYLMSGNNAPAQEWTIFRVDLGTTGASKN